MSKGKIDVLAEIAKCEKQYINSYMNAQNTHRSNNGNASEDECVYIQNAINNCVMILQYNQPQFNNIYAERKSKLENQLYLLRKELKQTSEKNADSSLNNEKKSKDALYNERIEAMVERWHVKPEDMPKHGLNDDDVSGMSELKNKLRNCIKNSTSSDLNKYLGIPELNSYFFIGPPGCGKTYIIEAFIHELINDGYDYMSLSGSDIISRYAGDAEKIVERLFKEIKNTQKCVVFIDEIDSVVKNRSLPNLPEYAANITTQFLIGYNAIHSRDSEVIFLCASNYPQRVDNAMLDRMEVIEVGLPDYEARKAEFIRDLKNIVCLSDNLSFDIMAGDTEGTCIDGKSYGELLAMPLITKFNYRDIERIVIAVKRRLFKKSLEEYTTPEKAIEALKSGECVLTLDDWNSVISVFHPSPKRDIIVDIAEWKEQNLEDEYSEDENNYPAESKLTKHDIEHNELLDKLSDIKMIVNAINSLSDKLDKLSTCSTASEDNMPTPENEKNTEKKTTDIIMKSFTDKGDT